MTTNINTERSFTDFLTGITGAEPTNNDTKTVKERKNTPGQIQYYQDLCDQRSIQYEDGYKTWSFDRISARIQELLKFKPMNKRQNELLMTKIMSVSKLVANMKFEEEDIVKLENSSDPTIIFLAKIIRKDTSMFKIIPTLTGGLEGTGSKLISGLIDIEKLYSDQMPPSDKQIEMMIGMYLCSDVDFEKYDISRTITLKDGLWRKMTPDEFKEQLVSVLTKNIASKLLNEFQGAFYDWKKTRIRPQQMSYIRSLEEQLSTIHKNDTIEYSIDMEGNIVENKIESESIKGANYIPLDDEQLIMFSIEEASEFIDQLKAELNRKEGSTLTEEYIDSNELRFANSVEEAINIEYEEFTKLMYKLQSVAGYEDEELVEVANINLVADNSVEANKENRKKIREFMQDLLENEAISFYELLELTKESITAQRILIDM